MCLALFCSWVFSIVFFFFHIIIIIIILSVNNTSSANTRARLISVEDQKYRKGEIILKDLDFCLWPFLVAYSIKPRSHALHLSYILCCITSFVILWKKNYQLRGKKSNTLYMFEGLCRPGQNVSHPIQNVTISVQWISWQNSCVILKAFLFLYLYVYVVYSPYDFNRNY